MTQDPARLAVATKALGDKWPGLPLSAHANVAKVIIAAFDAHDATHAGDVSDAAMEAAEQAYQRAYREVFITPTALLAPHRAGLRAALAVAPKGGSVRKEDAELDAALDKIITERMPSLLREKNVERMPKGETASAATAAKVPVLVVTSHSTGWSVTSPDIPGLCVNAPTYDGALAKVGQALVMMAGKDTNPNAGADTRLCGTPTPAEPAEGRGPSLAELAEKAADSVRGKSLGMDDRGEVIGGGMPALDKFLRAFAERERQREAE